MPDYIKKVSNEMVAFTLNETLKSIARDDPSIDNWQILKRYVLNRIKWEYRTLFSTRDQKTKIPNCNEFERAMIRRWEMITGTKILFIGKYRYSEDYSVENVLKDENAKKAARREKELEETDE